MKHVGLLVVAFVLAAPSAWGQAQRCEELLGREPDEAFTVADNDVSVLAAAGDSLWVGPRQGIYCTPSNEQPGFFGINTLTSALGSNTVSVIAARNGASKGNLVWVGLAFDTGGGETGANGFLVSGNGGESFTRRAPSLDGPTDTTIVYGGSTVAAVPITQKASSTPQDLAFGPKGDTVWVAGQRGGIRWTVDSLNVETPLDWRRTVLPPDTSRSVAPTTPTDVLVSPPLTDGRGSFNHLGFSVLVDETGTVWAGTGGGLNRSRPEGVAADGSRAWRRFSSAEPGDGPPGNVVVALAEQPEPGGRNPIWVVAQPNRQQREGRTQRFGVAVTDDGGGSFRQTLIGERITDLAARQARVYAVGPTGLFVSADRGESWRSVEQFPLQDRSTVLPSDVEAQSVAVTPSSLWVGTTDGLLRLDRTDEQFLPLGAPDPSEEPTWQLFRARTPVNPEAPSDEAPDVSTYAYPNPFVPSEDELVRIVYERKQAGPVTVTIYDFGMNKIKTLTDRAPSSRQHETVWRGTDDRGLRVPTGTYFYRVDLGRRTVDGKILVTN